MVPVVARFPCGKGFYLTSPTNPHSSGPPLRGFVPFLNLEPRLKGSSPSKRRKLWVVNPPGRLFTCFMALVFPPTRGFGRDRSGPGRQDLQHPEPSRGGQGGKSSDFAPCRPADPPPSPPEATGPDPVPERDRTRGGGGNPKAPVEGESWVGVDG